MKKLLVLTTLLMPLVVSAFDRNISEIQVYSDKVRLKVVGSTYGTCGDEKNAWWGWNTSNERHRDWLAIALTAKASGKKVGLYDYPQSCRGGADFIALEGLFLKNE